LRKACKATGINKNPRSRNKLRYTTSTKHPRGKILVANRIHPAGLTLLKRRGFKISIADNIPNGNLILTLSRTHTDIVIVRSVRKIGDEMIRALSRQTDVKLICTASSGIDHIDRDTAKAVGIKIINAPDGNFVSAAEHTFALILAIEKNLFLLHRNMKAGIFDNRVCENCELSGKTVGILGVGRVGSYLAKICRAFSMRILGNDIKDSLRKKYKWIEFVSLRRLLQLSDIVTVHTPLDASTRNLLGGREIRMMKHGAILINCARGGIVNEKSLIDSLNKGKIAYAGLDVFENEPSVREEIIKQPHVLLTPHVAGKTKESDRRISVQLAEAICKFAGLSTR
jgi:D-3-phosphoglycerate dehydrogenase